MSEQGEQGLDNLMLGNASEGVSEKSSEQIVARAAAAAQKMQQLRRDEASAKTFDEQLAKILPTLSIDLIDFVAFLITTNIPSLTILALLSIGSNPVTKTGAHHFSSQKEPLRFETDISVVKFENTKIAPQIDRWWRFIFLADTASTTLRLSDLRTNQPFVTRVSKELSTILKTFLAQNKVENFNKSELERVLNARGKQIFTDTRS